MADPEPAELPALEGRDADAGNNEPGASPSAVINRDD
jgi:hypothetical protein